MYSGCIPGRTLNPREAWITTHSGRKFFYVRQPDEHGDIDIQDIAVSLSREPRYCGHTARNYSVAQHSVLVAEELARRGRSARTQMIGLLHDAPEFVMKDIPRPLKQLLGTVYTDLETGVWNRISHKYLGAVVKIPAVVKEVDNALYLAEALDLFSFQPLNFTPERFAKRLAEKVIAWPEDRARREFLYVFESIRTDPDFGVLGRTNLDTADASGDK